MSIPTQATRSRTLTTLRRADIQAALERADATGLIPPESFYARHVDFQPSGVTCLAYDMDTATDLAVFVAVVGALTGSVLAFAHDAQPIPGSREGTVTWPWIVLAEATSDEWDDAHNEDEDRDAVRAAVEDAMAGSR